LPGKYKFWVGNLGQFWAQILPPKRYSQNLLLNKKIFASKIWKFFCSKIWSQQIIGQK
jgi:hypothetical protein